MKNSDWVIYYSEEWLTEWGGNWRPAYERMLEILE